MEIPRWIEEEFANVSIGDLRLDRRLKSCVACFGRFGESTPERCASAAKLKATYRFVDNPKVSMETVLDEHNRATIERCQGKKRIYQIQDTTEFDLTKPRRQVEGAGPLGTAKRRGFFFHPVYALDDRQIPVGVLDQVVWTRTDESLQVSSRQRAANRRQMSFAEKESSRWLEMLQSGEQIARSIPDTEFIHIADSEGDISEVFCESQLFPSNFHFVIRGGRQHAVLAATDTKSGKSLTGNTVAETLCNAESRFHHSVECGPRQAPTLPEDRKRSGKQQRTARQASVAVRAIKVALQGPRRPGGGSLPDVKLNVIELLERQPPEGEPPIHWVLYTTMPIETEPQIRDVIESYRQRWSIELFFKTCKSGLKIEDMKYEKLSRYLVAFAISMVVAWRVEYLKGAARKDPDSSCEKYFTPEQWMAIVMFATQTKPDPDQPPTTKEFLRIVAQLGGYLNKKSQGPPGSKTLWRGIRKFDTVVEAYQIFHLHTCGV